MKCWFGALAIAVWAAGIAVRAQEVPPAASFAAQVSQTTYTLGPGDGLQVLFFNVPELSGARTVLPDGSLSLPLVGSLAVEGLTPDQLSERLTELYRPYLSRPRVSVTIERPRPVTFTVAGEVNRPGPYTFQPVQSVTPAAGTAAGATVINRLNVSAAIAQAGGLTERSNVREVMLVRQLPGGQVSRRTLDLWALLQQGDPRQNPTLQDGDALIVPMATGERNLEYDLVAQSSLSPEQIEVQVVGEVLKPGAVRVRSGAPLTAALIGAGGLTNLSDPTAVELVRLNRDGTVTRKVINARLEQPTDNQLNPPLRQSDMVVVRQSFGGRILNAMGTVTQPFAQAATVLLLFRAFR